MTLPPLDLDNKNFQELVDEAKKLIPVYAPDWTDFNVHDPGITIIELFAWLAEMQMYSLNQITEENKIKYLKILGTKPESASPAVADVTFSLNKQVIDQNETSVLVPQGTKLSAKNIESNEDIIFQTDREINISSVNLVGIFSQNTKEVKDNTSVNAIDGHYYYAFGEKAETGSVLYLGFKGLQSKGSIDLRIYLYEDDLIKRGHHGDEQPGIIPSAIIRWEYLKISENKCEWIPLELLSDETQAFTYSGTISFKTPKITLKSSNKKECKELPFRDDHCVKDDRCLYWIRCVVLKEGYEVSPRIYAIKTNTVPVVQSETPPGGIYFSSDGTKNQIFQLPNTPVLSEEVWVNEINALSKAEIKKINENGDFELRELKDKDGKITEFWIKWKPVETLLFSSKEDRNYVIDHNTGKIQFGDGTHGYIPPIPFILSIPSNQNSNGEENIQIIYSFGGGEMGNVKAGGINQILDSEIKYKLKVGNTSAAYGGTNQESLDDAIIRVKKDIKEPYPAVTSEDYEYLAKMTPGMRVRRAKAIPDAKNGLVSVIVVPESTFSKPLPSDGFITTVEKHLRKHSLITTQVEVMEPTYVGVSVNATLKVRDGYEPENVQSTALNTLNSFINPLTGGLNRDGWPFGRNVHISEVYEVLDDVTGVDYVQNLKIKDEEHDYGAGVIQIPNFGLVYSLKHAITTLESDDLCQRSGFS